MVVEKGVLFSMKSTCKLLVKVFVLIAFLYLTPFASGLKHCFRNADDLLNNFVYKQKTINSSLSLKDSLNVLSYNSNLTIPKEDISEVETTQDNPSVVPKTTDEQKDTSQSKDDGKNNKAENSDKKTEEKSEDKKVKSTGKRVYIYDTRMKAIRVAKRCWMLRLFWRRSWRTAALRWFWKPMISSVTVIRMD